MKYIMTLLTLGLIGCGGDVNVQDSEHVAYVSIAETWREVCEDRFNEYDFPNYNDRDELQAECRRKFADGEEELDIPELPTL